MVFGSFLSLASALSVSCLNGTECSEPIIQQAPPPPIIIRGHTNQTLPQASSTILPCSANGRPPLTISWLRDGKPLEENARFQQLSSGSLQINDLMMSDSSVYTCAATNEDGESSWSAALKIVEHRNPDAIFSRMPDAAQFAGSPGKPRATNVSDSSVDLEWTAPSSSASSSSPITGYTLQFFAPHIARTWFNVPDFVAGAVTKHTVRGLLPETTYQFVVRAENAHGLGAPSEPSLVIRTDKRRTRNVENADDVRARLAAVQLRLDRAEPINSTAVRVSWRSRPDDVVSGYYVKWRAAPKSGRPKNDEDEDDDDDDYDDGKSSAAAASDSIYSSSNMFNISSQYTTEAIVSGLAPFTLYEFFAVAYHHSSSTGGEVQGIPSNMLAARTNEAPPSAPPVDVRVRMLNMTTLRVSWKSPPASMLNGVLKGFQIVVMGKNAKFNRNITTNERGASVTLFHLVPGMIYKVRVAARSGGGIGIYHGTELVAMTPETLARHQAEFEAANSIVLSLLQKKWFVVALILVLWLALMLLCLFGWLRWRRGRDTKPDRLGPFIKINDGSMHHPHPHSYQQSHLHRMADGSSWTDQSSYAGRGIYGDGGGGGGAADAAMYSARTAIGPAPGAGATFLYHADGTLCRAVHHHHHPPGAPGSDTLYTYAQLTTPRSIANYGQAHHAEPSPYATSAIAMANGLLPGYDHHAGLSPWMSSGALHTTGNGPLTPPPMPPSHPVPSRPPPGFDDAFMCAAAANNRSRRCIQGGGSSSNDSGSQPHTDVSYVHSLSGTTTRTTSRGRSLEKQRGGGNAGRQTPPRDALAQMIPPPPAHPISSSTDCLEMRERSFGGEALQAARQIAEGRALNPSFDANAPPDDQKRNAAAVAAKRVHGRRSSRPGDRVAGGSGEDSSQRSCLIENTSPGAIQKGGDSPGSGHTSSDVADAEMSEDEENVKGSVVGAGGGSQKTASRQPRMGVSASQLNQSVDGANNNVNNNNGSGRRAK